MYTIAKEGAEITGYKRLCKYKDIDLDSIKADAKAVFNWLIAQDPQIIETCNKKYINRAKELGYLQLTHSRKLKDKCKMFKENNRLKSKIK